jgi:two-component system chemotaxis response regulator CheB
MAVQTAKGLQPDIIVLDIEMPRMDGITALPELLKVSPRSKIIMTSTLSTRNASISIQALSLGASDYVAKPTAKSPDELDIFYRELRYKIHALAPRSCFLPKAPAQASSVPLPKAPSPAPVSKPYPVLSAGTPLNPAGIAALAIASSTGGPQALTALFTQLKGQLKNIPIFITQHMPPTFTTILAEHISKAGERVCHEAIKGEAVLPGCAYLAPGDFHMVVEKNATGQTVLTTNQNPPENFCRPAADPMLRSLSQIYGSRLAVVVLTGMGQDGMEGAKIVVSNGGSVIAQDEASCVVYGMPKAVVEHNLCKAVLPITDIGAFLIRHIDGAAK